MGASKRRGSTWRCGERDRGRWAGEERRVVCGDFYAGMRSTVSECAFAHTREESERLKALRKVAEDRGKMSCP